MIVEASSLSHVEVAASTALPPAVVPSAPIVLEQATLGVTRPRRRSRPSVSPERGGSSSDGRPNNGGGAGGSGGPGGSPSGGSSRMPRLRRQSTTLDEGI